MEYSTIGILAIVLNMILNHKFLFRRTGRTDLSDSYSNFLYSSIGYYLSDALWGILYSTRIAVLIYVDTLVYFVTMALTVVLLCRYITLYLNLRNLMGKLLNAFGMIFFITETSLLLLNHYTHIFFWVESDGTYEAYGIRYVILIIQVLLFIILTVQTAITISREKGSERRRRLSIMLFCIEMIVAIIMQIFYPLLPFYALGLILGTAIIHSFVNENELEEKQIRLENAIIKAQAANNAKSVFLNNMSHDIRTPMNAILGFTKLIKKNLDNTEKVRNYINKIEVSGEYLLSIINSVLDMARIESGKVELDEGIMDIEDTENQMLSMFNDDTQKKKQTLTHSMNISHRYVVADKAKVNQIMMNLVSNSVKYTPEGGTIDVNVVEAPSDRTGYASFVFTVSDNGIGMSEDFLTHIFDSFSRERTTTESKVIGTGLGMSIVKKLVDMMGGTIEVRSELNKGSTFNVRLSFRTVEAQVKTDDNNEKLDEINVEGHRILISEDNDLNAEIALELLEDMGVEAVRVCDGVQVLDALEKAPSGYYELILMDIQMPNMNGYETTRRIRGLEDRSKAEIPIIAMTANAFEEDRRTALKAKMNGHVAKPIDAEILKKTISQMLCQD